jgi:hypothetical protein
MACSELEKKTGNGLQTKSETKSKITLGGSGREGTFDH